MKFTIKLLALFFGVLMLANFTYAESPREQLKQMVEQLQKTPTDNALREKIVKLAQEMKPAPAVPEEAERRMMRGTAALEGVKSVADYQNAAKEFELATLAAPWYGDAYFNLGVAQDKAENYEAALRSLKLALLASPNDKEIKSLIFKVEYRNEKAHSPEAAAAREREKEDALIKSLDGAVYVRHNFVEKVLESDSFCKVNGDTLSCSHRITAIYDQKTANNLEGHPTWVGLVSSDGFGDGSGIFRWTNGHFIYEDSRVRMKYTPRLKGQMLRLSYFCKLEGCPSETYNDLQRQ